MEWRSSQRNTGFGSLSFNELNKHCLPFDARASALLNISRCVVLKRKFSVSAGQFDVRVLSWVRHLSLDITDIMQFILYNRYNSHCFTLKGRDSVQVAHLCNIALGKNHFSRFNFVDIISLDWPLAMDDWARLKKCTQTHGRNDEYHVDC